MMQPTSSAKKNVPSPDAASASDTDDMAAKEEQAHAKNLNLEKKTADHRRAEALRDLFGSGVHSIVSVVIVIVIVAIIVIAWHHLSPTNWRWLSDDNLAELRSFFFSGAIVGAISLYIQRNL